MCMGDWRLGRLIRSRVSSWNATGSVNLVLLPNPQRVGVTFSLSSLGAGSAATATLSIDAIIAAIFNSTYPSYHYSMINHGDLPTKRFEITASSTAPTGSWIEYFAPENVLAQALESMRGQYGMNLQR